MPGLREGVGYVKRDESRHLGYSIFLLGRLIAEDPALWPLIEGRMGELLTPAIGVINELFAAYEVMPFGLKVEDFIDYAMNQFDKRLTRIERSRGQSLAQLYQLTDDEVAS
jgi:ribonucleoside-diphosphate reductase beta chain